LNALTTSTLPTNASCHSVLPIRTGCGAWEHAILVMSIPL
jgi:hypothetical protein